LGKLYIIGGQQKDRILDEWHQYKKGVIVKIDMNKNQVESSLEFISPPEARPDNDPSILFKAGTVKNQQLYVCTQTEILIYSLPSLKQTGYLSLPCFNDVHHVRPTNGGNFLVVSTGLDMVVEVTANGTILREWNVLGQNPWERFSHNIDYRKVHTTKPHYSHPNYVFQIGKDIWATRCLQQDAICLTRPQQQIEIGGSLIHDGVLVRDTIYFTKVIGHVVTVDINTLKVKQVFNLNEMTSVRKPLGWCRGIKVLNKHTVIVGFTRLRPTIQEVNGQFIEEGWFDTLPTRIVCYNLTKGKLLWEHSLEPYGLNAVFSIHSENE
jgi:outer membrane protein assembly factor BamB